MLPGALRFAVSIKSIPPVERFEAIEEVAVGEEWLFGCPDSNNMANGIAPMIGEQPPRWSPWGIDSHDRQFEAIWRRNVPSFEGGSDVLGGCSCDRFNRECPYRAYRGGTTAEAYFIDAANLGDAIAAAGGGRNEA